MQPKFTSRAGTTILMLAALFTGVAAAQTIPAAVQDATTRILSTMPELRGAKAVSNTPAYAPRSKKIMFWEVKFITGKGLPAGYMFVDLNGKVIEMGTKGLSKTERLARLTKGQPFKTVRLTSHFAVAEDGAGKVIAQLGRQPRLFSDHVLNREIEAPAQTVWSFDRATARAGDTQIYRQYTNFDAAYNDYATNYERLFVDRVFSPNMPDSGMMRQMTIPNDDNGTGNGDPLAENGNATSAAYAEAIGRGNTIRMKQLAPYPQEPLNDRSWFSGCGPTAVFNMLAWHDNNWVPDLLHGSPSNPNTQPSNYTVLGQANYTKMLREAMGTFNSPGNDQGATFPWDMDQGLKHAQNYGSFNVDRAYTYALPFSPSARDLVKTAIKTLGKPAIIGYWSDIHYDLAYKYFSDGGIPKFYVDLDDEDGVWVDGDDLFYAAVVYNYEIKGNLITNGSFEAGNPGWGGTGARGITLRNMGAHQGLAFGWLGSSTGAAGTILRFMPYKNNALSYTVEAYFKAPAGAKAWIKVVNIMNNTVERSVSVPTSSNWTRVQLGSITQTTTPRTVLLMVEGASGNNLTLVDSVRIMPTMPQGLPGNDPGQEPCVPAKPGGGMTDGCFDIP
ncbi:MAG: hypothetical protein R2729_21410 [Bryobacteraceae bacterium]